MDINQDIRYARILTEEFYLLNLQKESNKTIFTVSGSTANVYQVSLYDYSGKIFCNCPDLVLEQFQLQGQVLVKNAMERWA